MPGGRTWTLLVALPRGGGGAVAPGARAPPFGEASRLGPGFTSRFAATEQQARPRKRGISQTEAHGRTLDSLKSQGRPLPDRKFEVP